MDETPRLVLSSDMPRRIRSMAFYGPKSGKIIAKFHEKHYCEDDAFGVLDHIYAQADIAPSIPEPPPSLGDEEDVS